MAAKKPKATKVTPKKAWKPLALQALRTGATIAEAAKAAGVNRVTLYKAPERDPAFKAAMEEAIEEGTDTIEAAATYRAVHGVDEPVIYQGQWTFVGVDKDGKPCDPASPLAVKNVPLTVRKPSDTLAIFILKGRRPHKFRDNATVTHQGPGGGPIQTETKHAVDYDAIEAELRNLAARGVAGGTAADN